MTRDGSKVAYALVLSLAASLSGCCMGGAAAPAFPPEFQGSYTSDEMPGVTLVLGSDTIDIQSSGSAAVTPQTARFTRIECDATRCTTDSATLGGDIEQEFDGTTSFQLGTVSDGPSPISNARWRRSS